MLALHLIQFLVFPLPCTLGSYSRGGIQAGSVLLAHSLLVCFLAKQSSRPATLHYAVH